MKVTLRPLDIVDLKISYARNMGNNKIRHYHVSAIQYLIPGTGLNPLDAVKDHIRNEEGADTEFEVLGSSSLERVSSGALRAEDVTDQVLRGRSKIRRQLEKRTINSQIHQFMDIMTRKDAENMSINSFDRKGNLVSEKVKFGFKEVLANLAFSVGLSRFIPEKYFVRKVNPCTYLAYNYREQDEQKAFDALRNDLSILSKHGLIQGHLAMPFTLLMADVIGCGELPKVLGCFVFADLDKLYRQVNLSPLEAYEKFPDKKPLTHLLGVVGETLEGGVGVEISANKYELEAVYVEIPNSQSDANRQAVIDNYNSSREYTNKVAAHKKQELNRWEKISGTPKREQVVLGTGRQLKEIEVEAELLNKDTGEVVKLSDAYRRNSDN